MIYEPTERTAAPASRAFLATMRLRVGQEIADRTDADLLTIAAQVATLAYSGQHAAVWEFGRRLGMHDHTFSVLVHETFAFYPVAAVVQREDVPADA